MKGVYISVIILMFLLAFIVSSISGEMLLFIPLAIFGSAISVFGIAMADLLAFLTSKDHK